MTSEDLERLAQEVGSVLTQIAALREALDPQQLVALSIEDQTTLLAGVLERARLARRGMDAVCAAIGEAAFERGASPRMLDWADGRDER